MTIEDAEQFEEIEDGHLDCNFTYCVHMIVAAITGICFLLILGLIGGWIASLVMLIITNDYLWLWIVISPIIAIFVVVMLVIVAGVVLVIVLCVKDSIKECGSHIYMRLYPSEIVEDI